MSKSSKKRKKRRLLKLLKSKKILMRIPTAPPAKVFKTKKDYNRQKIKQQTRNEIVND